MASSKSAYDPTARALANPDELYDWKMSFKLEDIEKAIRNQGPFFNDTVLVPIEGYHAPVGTGAFGSVYYIQFNPPVKATQETNHQRYLSSGNQRRSVDIAIKVINRDKWAYYSYKHEVAALSAISKRPNKNAQFLRMYYNHWDSTNGKGYIVMDIVPFKLDHLIYTKENKVWVPTHIPLLRVAKFALQLFSQVEHLHKLGFVHRDIDPSNILFESMEGALILIDYGLAERLDLGENDYYATAGKACNYPPLIWTDATQDECIQKSASRTDKSLRALLLPSSDAFATGLVVLQLLYREHQFVLGSESQAGRSTLEFNRSVVMHLQHIKNFESLHQFYPNFPNSRGDREKENFDLLLALEKIIWKLLRLTTSSSDQVYRSMGAHDSKYTIFSKCRKKDHQEHRATIKEVYEELKKSLGNPAAGGSSSRS